MNYIEQNQADVEKVLEAIEHIKQGSYITGYSILTVARNRTGSIAFSKFIDEIVRELKQVEESNTFVFIKYCKGEIERILNETDNKITSGFDLGLYIAENVRIPEDQQDQLKQAWAEELLEYLEFAYEEGNLEANPFSEQSKFLKNAVSQATKIMIQLSDTCVAYWDSTPHNILDVKERIIEEIIAIESIRFEEIF